MSKFLISYYPVYPAEKVNIYDLDALKFEDGTSLKGVKKQLKQILLCTIYDGMHRVGGYVNKGIFFAYSNNSMHFVVTAANVRDALDQWRALLSEPYFKKSNQIPKVLAIRMVKDLFEELGIADEEIDAEWKKETMKYLREMEEIIMKTRYVSIYDIASFYPVLLAKKE